jgi:hypothetical protein
LKAGNNDCDISFNNQITKIMKTTLKLIFLLTLSAMIFSCKKSSNSSSAYYFKGNYNGTPKTFNTAVTASKTNLGSGIYSLTIVGATTAEESAIELWSNQDNFTAGSTYSVTASGVDTYNSLSYVSPLGSSAPSSIWSTVYDYGVVDQSFSCTITEATSTYIKGTFSGVLYMSTDSAVVTKVVDGGQFYAKFF